MIFWLFVILLAGGIIWTVISHDTMGISEFLSGAITGVVSIITGVMLAAIIVIYITAASNSAQYAERYKVLTYKAQTESIRDEFGIVNKDYIDEVQEWNEMVIRYQTLMNNKWTYIFYPKSVCEDLKTIDYDSIQMKK